MEKLTIQIGLDVVTLEQGDDKSKLKVNGEWLSREQIEQLLVIECAKAVAGGLPDEHILALLRCFPDKHEILANAKRLLENAKAVQNN